MVTVLNILAFSQTLRRENEREREKMEHTEVKRMFPEVAAARCVQTIDIISRMNCYKELTHRFQDRQIRRMPHDVLYDVHIHGADNSSNLFAPFALSFLEKLNRRKIKVAA